MNLYNIKIKRDKRCDLYYHENVIAKNYSDVETYCKEALSIKLITKDIKLL